MQIKTTFAMLALIGLGACTTAGPAAQAGAGKCRAAEATGLVGQPAPDDATLLGRTGGKMVRRLLPGEMRTQDYREDRLTVELAHGRIIAASCG